MSEYALALDIGGTFTDVTLVDDTGEAVTAKVLTTPADLVRGCIEGIAAVLAHGHVQPNLVTRVVHATTQGTNVILEGTRAPVALLVTSGFADLIRIGGSDGRDIYDLRWQRWLPPADPGLTFDIPERIGADGEIVRPLDEGAVARIAEQLQSARPDAVAVCLLNSYAYPEHERRVGEMLRDAVPDCRVALSSEVWPEQGEYARIVATVLSAYIGPVMDGYLARLEQAISDTGIPGTLEVMQSNGGTMSARDTTTRPLFSLESGPAAGVLGAANVGTRLRRDRVISFDMGGTTAKVALIADGAPGTRGEFRVGGGTSGGDTGALLRLPVLDLAEVGAGGGSIAWIDDGGMLQVGPHSAGADPGPACYGRGGTQPTVTDANLLLGYLSPTYFVGGALPLHGEHAEAAFAPLAARMGCSIVSAAAAVHDIVNLNMEDAVRVVSLARGRDPREFTAVAFGGAGPTHIAGMASTIGIRHVVVPALAGVFSTVGLLVSDAVYEEVRVLALEVDDLSAQYLEKAFHELEAGLVPKVELNGFRPEQIVTERSVAVRRRRQSHDLVVPVGHDIDEAETTAIRERYFREYERVYGVKREGPLVVHSCRVRVRGRTDRVSVAAAVPTGARGIEHAAKGPRLAWSSAARECVNTPVFERSLLTERDVIEGPALVEEVESTTVVPTGWSVRVARSGDLLLDMRDEL